MIAEAVLKEEINENVISFHLNRPERGNSLNEALIRQLHARLQWLEREDRWKVIVFTGVGDRFFCGGADLKEFLHAKKNVALMLSQFAQVLDRISRFSCLTASFVNGDCVGGGLGIALSTDYTLVASHAKLGTPEITRGLFPYIISKPLIRCLGEARAKALCFGGRLWSATEAQTLGAISELVPSERFRERGQELVKLWNETSRETLVRGKSCLSLSEKTSSNTLQSYLQEAILDVRGRE